MNKEIDIQTLIDLTQGTPTARTQTCIKPEYPQMMSGTTSICYVRPYIQMGCAAYSGNLSQMQGLQNFSMGQCAVIGNIREFNSTSIL